MRINTKILFPLFLLFSSMYLDAQIYNALNVTRKEGLSDSNVKSICVDYLGYVWFGTEHGLNRYDGFETLTFYNDINDTSTISNNLITEIFEDGDRNLFVITGSGLNLYNRETNTFRRIRIGEKSESLLIAHEDETDVWIAGSTSCRLWLFNKSDKSIREEFINFKENSVDNSNLFFNRICEYDDNNLLFALPFHGLFLLDKTTKVFKPFLSLPISNYKGLFTDGDYIWVGSIGILKVHKHDKTITRYNASNSDLTNGLILSFKKHPLTNNLWVTTDGSGIQEFDTSFKLVRHYVSGPKVNQLLPANSINTICFTNKGEIWVGTVRAGAVLLYHGNFEHFSFVDNTSAGPSSGIIVKIIDDNKNNIWLATDGGGLNKFNPENYSFQSFQKGAFEKNTGVVNFSKNTLLLSEYMGQLYFFNSKTNLFSDAHIHPLLKNIKRNANCRLYKDLKNNIWIWDNRLVKINLAENTNEVFLQDKYPEAISEISPLFYSVAEDTINDRLWFGAMGGLYAYNYKSKQIEHLVVLNKIRNIFGSIVYSIVVTHDSKVVFGTSKGLFIYNPETRLISNYWEENTFNNTVFQTLFLNDGVLWAATSEGLFKIIPNAKPEDVIKYQVGNQDFRSSSYLIANDGKVYLGTNNGFIRFSPELIKEDTLASDVLITSFQRTGTEKGSEFKNTILSNVSETVSAKIPFSNSVYQFNFNSFDIPFQDKISYSYSLKGFEEIWHTGKSRRATYTNLAPGEYTFVVKASTKNGTWNTETTQLQFEVMPAWWQTVWFKLLLIGLFIGISGLIWNELLKRAKLKHLVEVEKMERDRLKEVNQMKLRFFTNISHELRTPLTLIYSPLKKMVAQNTSIEEIKNGLPGLFRNAKRMKFMVDQILEFRKAEMDELHLKLGSFDFIDFCREIIDSFHFMANSEGVQIRFVHTQEQLFFNFDHDKFTKIMFNLFSNALKYSPPNGKIVLTVKQEQESVFISLSDMGKGIHESKLKSIFDRYFQVENDVDGTGIGLALTKKLVNLHKGEIWAESTEGKGSVFNIKVPFRSDVIVEENSNRTSIVEDQIDQPYDSIKKVDIRNTANLSILIVEDDWELNHYLETEFKANFNVITATNGKTGLALATEEVPDIIISDVMMPEMNGYEFCKAVRDDIRISHIPVVLLTAKTMVENKIEGYKSGADLYVSKPFDKEVLLSQIEALLKNRELLKRRFSNDLNFNIKEITYSETDEKLMHKAIGIVQLNLQNTQFDVNDFVDNLGISRTLAYKKIKAISGKSINDFILSVRLQKAGVLLQKTNKTISEIAIETGFSDHSYFSAVFKKNYKMSPSEFRQKELES